MKRILVLVVLVSAGVAVSAPAVQAKDVARYQFTTATYYLCADINNFGCTYPHSYVITINPCDGTFSGTGGAQPPNGVDESITGTIAGTVINYTSVYTNLGYPYNYSLVNGAYNPADGSFIGTGTSNEGQGLFLIGTRTSATQSDWRNHGDYVSSQPPDSRETAAQSCIGKPIEDG